MRTIERNYRKHPHTASFLKAFHTGGNGLAADATAPAEEPDTITTYSFGAVNESADLLDEVPVDAPPADLRSPAQASLMSSLVAQITDLDEALGRAAGEWTAKATAAGHWTPGREGTASAWITRMIAKVAELKASAKVTTSPAPVAAVADGRYAVEEGGVLKFFKVKNGRRFVFLDVQASDDWHRVHYSRIPKILALIAVDPKAAMIRYGQELGQCGHCGRTLTDAASRAAGIGPICMNR